MWTINYVFIQCWEAQSVGSFGVCQHLSNTEQSNSVSAEADVSLLSSFGK